MEFSFLHVSDIHLDRPFSGLSQYSFDNNLEQVYKSAIDKAFNSIIDFAILKNVDFVLIAGDTFDSSEHDFSSKLTLKRGLLRLLNAEIPVYLICGNHDSLMSYSKSTFNFDENSLIKIIGLNTPNNSELQLKNKKGEFVATLHALSFTDDKFNSNPAVFLKKADSGFNIGLLHCDLNASSTSPYAPCLLSDLKNLNYDYFALGHIHKPSFNDDFIQYSGTIQGRNSKETGAHGIRYIKVRDNVIIKNSFVPTDIIRFENITLDISSIDDSVDVFNLLEDKINEIISLNSESAEIFLITPYITGCTNCYSDINENFFYSLSEKIKTDFAGKVYLSKAECSISPKIDDEILKSDNGIIGEIFRTCSNDTVLNNSFELVEQSLKNFIDKCNFSDEEFQIFKNNIVKNAKEDCKNLCSIIFDDNN